MPIKKYVIKNKYGVRVFKYDDFYTYVAAVTFLKNQICTSDLYIGEEYV
jgi:hypothetical protein